MSRTRVLLIAHKEALQFFRSRKALLLTVALAILGISQVIILKWALPLPESSFSAILYGSYNTLVQLLPLALVVVLAASICGEKESRVWYFYLSKPFRKPEIVLGKTLFYNSAILLATLLVWLMIAGATWWIAEPANVTWVEFFHVSLIVLSVTFAVINMEIMFSSLAGNTVTAALLIVTVWVALTIGNAALERVLGEGILAPFAARSIQTDIVMRVLDMGVPDCPSCPPASYPSTLEITRACLHALIEGSLFATLATFIPRGGD